MPGTTKNMSRLLKRQTMVAQGELSYSYPTYKLHDGQYFSYCCEVLCAWLTVYCCLSLILLTALQIICLFVSKETETACLERQVYFLQVVCLSVCLSVCSYICLNHNLEYMHDGYYKPLQLFTNVQVTFIYLEVHKACKLVKTTHTYILKSYFSIYHSLVTFL